MAKTKPLYLDAEASPLSFIELMYENTDEDGNIYFKNWYDIKKDDCESCMDFSCNIKWTKEDVHTIIKNYQLLYKELRIISKHLDELDAIHLAQTKPYIESSNGILEEQHLEATYFIYVAPFKANNEEQLHAQVIGRVGEDLFGYEMIRHARRLCQLMQLKAPKVIIENEGRMLIAAMAIYNCASSVCY